MGERRLQVLVCSPNIANNAKARNNGLWVNNIRGNILGIAASCGTLMADLIWGELLNKKKIDEG